MSMIVSPTTLKRKWPGSMIPACTGPHRDLVHALAAHLGERERRGRRRWNSRRRGVLAEREVVGAARSRGGRAAADRGAPRRRCRRGRRSRARSARPGSGRSRARRAPGRRPVPAARGVDEPVLRGWREQVVHLESARRRRGGRRPAISTQLGAELAPQQLARAPGTSAGRDRAVQLAAAHDADVGRERGSASRRGQARRQRAEVVIVRRSPTMRSSSVVERRRARVTPEHARAPPRRAPSGTSGQRAALARRRRRPAARAVQHAVRGGRSATTNATARSASTSRHQPRRGPPRSRPASSANSDTKRPKGGSPTRASMPAANRPPVTGIVRQQPRHLRRSRPCR